MYSMCTIISKNYISFARTLVQSFLELHPDGKAYVLLADENGGCIDNTRESFELIELAELGLPDIHAFSFKYGVTEFNTAVKPFFLDYLFRTRQLPKILYFDPDILIADRLDPLYAALDSHSIVLTPHILSPLPDDRLKPEEVDLLRAGVYNLGFIGLANTRSAAVMLQWWKERLYAYCFMEPDRGYHVDQKWLDFAPAMFDGVYISRDPENNMAYWNLHERELTLENGRYYVNGRPLRFYHFSGFQIDLGVVSRHQTRFKWRHVPLLHSLFERYRDLVMLNGYTETAQWRYAYDYFDNGVLVHALVRKLYNSLGDEAERFGNPFAAAKPDGFYRWMMSAPEGTVVPRVLRKVYETRQDLQLYYPDGLGVNQLLLLRWAAMHLSHEYGLRLPESAAAFLHSAKEYPGQ